MNHVLRVGLFTAALLLASCQKQPDAATAPAKTAAPASKSVTVELVKEPERSRNFTAVHRHLELGGTLYGFVDVEGDVLKLIGSLQGILGEWSKTDPKAAMFARNDLAEIAGMIGLTDVKALGVSSVPDGTGFFRNRMFLYTHGERHGLLAAFGGKPGPFKHTGLVPADAAVYAETEMDVSIVYKTIKDVVTKVAGEPVGNQLEETLKKAGEAATLALLDLIHGLKGHTALVLRVDPEKTMRLPGPEGLVLPELALFALVEGVGQIVEPSLAKMRELRRSEVGTMHVYEFAQPLPLPAMKPALVVDGTNLFITTSVEFLQQCRAQKSGLAQTPEFQQALERVGKEGNGLAYVSPRLFAGLRRLEALNEHLPAQTKSSIKFALAQLPAADRPLVSVRTNLDDGILVRSYYNRSLKQEVAAVSIYNPVTVGLLAAMAIPAFQKVRMASQEKAVLNNLRQLAAAADQYYLENGKRSARFDDLVGPGKYVRAINPVAGEQYRQIMFVQGRPISVKLPDGRVIQYPMTPAPGRPQPSRTPAPPGTKKK